MTAPTTFPRRAAVLLLLTAAAWLPACGDDARDAAPGKGPADVPAKSGTDAVAPAEGSVDLAKVTAAYDRALDFLLRHQKDGVWTSMMAKGAPDAGFTSLAVAALYGRPGGPRPGDREVAEKGAAFVAKSFAADGGVDAPGYRNYITSVAVMALVASGDTAYRPQIDKAVEYIKKLQFLDEKNPTYGGIGYGSNDKRADLSNTQYALASLRAAGVPESDPVFQRAVTYLSRVQNRKENETDGEPAEWVDDGDKTGQQKLVRSNDGGANYYPGNSKAGFDKRPDGTGVLRSYGSMTYALLRCYHLAGLDAKDGRVQAATDWISKNWELSRNPGMPELQKTQGLYYYYMTIGRTMPLTGVSTLTAGGKAINWRADLAGRLLSEQKEDGSWVNEAEARWMEGDPVLCTAYTLEALAGCAGAK
jgi:squalene-hopene/tetraprenyl-beta-curcumene cyclase